MGLKCSREACESQKISNSSRPYFVMIIARDRPVNRIKITMADKHVLHIVQKAIGEVCEPDLCLFGRDSVDGAFEIKFQTNTGSRLINRVDSKDQSDETINKSTANVLQKNQALNIQFKRLLCKILQEIVANGWKLVFSSDKSTPNSVVDLTTWFFQKLPKVRSASTAQQQQAQEKELFLHQLKFDFICLSFNGLNGVQLINCDNQSLIRCLRKTMISTYAYGIKEEKFHSGKDYEIKLGGSPFNGNDPEENLSIKRAILDIFRRFSEQGFDFYSTANLTGAATDCLFFTRKQNFDDANNNAKRQPNNNNYSWTMANLMRGDRLVLIDCSKKFVDDTRLAIMKYWPKGWQTESNFHSAWEFKLAGDPWRVHQDENVVARVRYFAAMLFNQWAIRSNARIVACVDMGWRSNGDASFILRTFPPNFQIPADYLSVTINEVDRIRIINGSPEVKSIVRKTIVDNWTFGLHKNQEKGGVQDLDFCCEYKLSQKPWSKATEKGQNYAVARKMMSNLLRALTDHGFSVICSSDICWHAAKYKKNSDKTNYAINGANGFYHTDMYSCFLVGSI